MVDPSGQGSGDPSQSQPNPSQPEAIAFADLYVTLQNLSQQFAEQQSLQQIQQAALETFSRNLRQVRSTSGASQQLPVGSNGSAPPNFIDIDNLAGDLTNRRDNPIQRPPHLTGDEARPALFDLSTHAGARKVKAVLGTHAAFEIETLGCSLSFLYDSAKASAEIAEAIKLLAPSGPNNTVSAEHAGLYSRV